MNPTTVLWLSLGAAALAVLYGIFTVRWVLSQPAGNARMQEIAAAIQEGANAYMNRQYTTIADRRRRAVRGPRLRAELVTRPIGFAIGAVFSGLAGYIGMFVSVRANVRTAQAATSGLNAALQIAFRGGAITGLLVVGLGLLGVAGYYLVLDTMGMRAGRDPQGARRPRLRRLADLDLRASRRRHLHEGRRRRRRPRRQSRSRHSRGRPAQPGRHRRQRRRQRRRLRRHGRGPVRDLRRHADRDDAARRPDRRRRLGDERGALSDRARRRLDRRVDHRHVLRQHEDRQDHAGALQGRDRLRRPRRDRVLSDHDGAHGRAGDEPLLRRADRPGADGRDGRHHRVLHGHELQPREEGRRGVDDGPRDQHHRGPRRVDEGHGAARARRLRRRSGARTSSPSSTASRSRPRACCR